MGIGVQKTGGCLVGVAKDLGSKVWISPKSEAKINELITEKATECAKNGKKFDIKRYREDILKYGVESAKSLGMDAVETSKMKMPYGTLTSVKGYVNGKDIQSIRCMLDKGGGVTLMKNRATGAIDAYYANCNQSAAKEVATFITPFMA